MKANEYMIGTQPNPKDRTKIQISDADARKLPQRGSFGVVSVFDKLTKQHVTVRAASCGLPNCLCALEFVKHC